MLHKSALKKGEISEELFSELNFLKDTIFSGEVVKRNAKITNEIQQGAKILSHQLQCDLRCAIDNQVAENKQKKIKNKKN